MGITLSIAELVAGAPYAKQFTFTLPSGFNVTGITGVFTDRLPGGFAVTEITSPVTLTLISGTTYKAYFSAAETAKFLSTDTNANSKLKYSSVYLHIVISGIDAQADSRRINAWSGEISVSADVQAAL